MKIVENPKFFYSIIFLFILGCESQPLLSVDGKNVTEKDIKYRLKIKKAYNADFSDTLGVIFTLIQQELREKVAKEIGIKISREELEKEALRFERNTKAPMVLSRVQKIFKNNRKGYLNRYVKPVLIERLLQEKFMFDTLYQERPWKEINKAYQSYKMGNFSDTSVKSFTPEKPRMVSYYKQYESDGISENKYSYFFVQKKDGSLQAFSREKNDFTDWFRDKAKKYPVRIYDSKLKKKTKRKIKGNRFWEEMIK